MERFRSFFVSLIITGTALNTVAMAAEQTPSNHVDYKITKSVSLGGPDKWDYLYFDAPSHRVFISHGNEVTVVDGHSGSVVGRLGGIIGGHGVTVAAPGGHGYATTSSPAGVILFDPKTMGALKTLPTGNGPDPAVSDPGGNLVYVMNGTSESVTLIDTKSDSVVGTVPLGGVPEFAAADGAGKLFVNIESTREIVRIDTRTAKVDARWPISDCDSPHGLAIDPQSRRLFATCVNSRMMVVDADNGKVVASIPIGKGSDAAAFDTKRKLAFSSNGEGTLSVIAELDADHFVSLGEVPTAPGAKTMTLDSDSGRIFLVTAEVTQTSPPKEEGRPPRFTFAPGTVKLLFLDPVF
jgi:YVTN family beta-propeller protein